MNKHTKIAVTSALTAVMLHVQSNAALATGSNPYGNPYGQVYGITHKVVDTALSGSSELLFIAGLALFILGVFVLSSTMKIKKLID